MFIRTRNAERNRHKKRMAHTKTSSAVVNEKKMNGKRETEIETKNQKKNRKDSSLNDLNDVRVWM